MHSHKFLFTYFVLSLGLQVGPAFSILMAEVLLCPVELCFALIMGCFEETKMFTVSESSSELSLFAFRHQSDAQRLLEEPSRNRLERFWTTPVQGAVRVYVYPIGNGLLMHLITNPHNRAQKDFSLNGRCVEEIVCQIESAKDKIQVDLLTFFQAIKNELQKYLEI